MKKVNETVAQEEAREQVRRACIKLALLHLSFAKTLVNELGEEEGRRIILMAIKDYGIRVGEDVKANVTAQGLDNNPANFKGDVPLYGMHDHHEVVNLDGEKRNRLYGCVMGQLWNELGEGELGSLYCYVDPAKYMAFNPNFKLIHIKKLPNGDRYCEFAIRLTTEQERKDFADHGKDWSYIDR